MSTCGQNGSSCYTTRTDGKRIGVRNRCKCGSEEIPRTLSVADTIKIDKELNEECACKGDECKTVELNYTSKPDNEGWTFLHKGRCGECSNPQDYSVYVKTAQNLTLYSKKAAFKSIFSLQAATDMMRSAGFTEQCSKCWVENMSNTLVHCFWQCIFSNNKTCEDGKLPKCLQCDEDYSGEYFRNCAGMTRRRAGIVTDICRQDGEIVDK